MNPSETEAPFDFFKRPERLFRYFSPEASDVFSTQKLWLSAANSFNDFFDVVPRFDHLYTTKIKDTRDKFISNLPPSIDLKQYEKQMDEMADQYYEEKMETEPQRIQNLFSEKYGIICFCSNLTSPAMWGHYTKNKEGENHSGFVVEFDPNHSIFPNSEFAKVNYSLSRPILNISPHAEIALTKSRDWDYESEHRLVKPLSEATSGIRRDGKKRHFIDLPFEAVRAVYFGLRVNPFCRDEILKDLKSPEWKDVKKFVMRRHHSEYALEPKPLEC